MFKAHVLSEIRYFWIEKMLFDTDIFKMRYLKTDKNGLSQRRVFLHEQNDFFV